MVEPLVFKENQDAGGTWLMVMKKKLPLVRQAVELGADIIKADPTDDVSQYHRVVEVVGKRLYSLEGRCQIKIPNELKISSGKVFRELFMEEMLSA